MKLFDVYPINEINIVRAKDSYVWDDNGVQYLDMYGGHAVISIGHSHPHWIQRIEDQLGKIAFYSNSVQIPIQKELAAKLGKISGKRLESVPGGGGRILSADGPDRRHKRYSAWRADFPQFRCVGQV